MESYIYAVTNDVIKYAIKNYAIEYAITNYEIKKKSMITSCFQIRPAQLTVNDTCIVYRIKTDDPYLQSATSEPIVPPHPTNNIQPCSLRKGQKLKTYFKIFQSLVDILYGVSLRMI